jgi:glyoxalase family protein
MTTSGIHHVTAICGDAQRNVEFYSRVLGLRLVKRTVNFDDPRTYHLYYGDELGSPGSLITFFPWPGAPRGRVGPGQVAITSFAVVPEALGFWIERLLRFAVAYRGPAIRRLGEPEERVVSFEDGDGLMLEIVGTPLARTRAPWKEAPGVPEAVAIRGIHAVTLWEETDAPTSAVLVDALGLTRPNREDESTVRFAARDSDSGSIADVRVVGGFPRGNVSVGTVHHVAWRVADEQEQLALRDGLVARGLAPTPVVDRQYFRSVYFREPGGVLFELATDGPGFAFDEPRERLGEQLRLPPHLEPYREYITASLPELHTPTDAGAHYRDA